MSLVFSRQKRITRRAMLFGGLQALALTALSGRLYYLQFIKSGDLRTQAENNRIKLQLVPPPRGILTDRTGESLAVNERNYQLYFDAVGMDKTIAKSLIADLQHMLKLDETVVEITIKTIEDRNFPPPLLLKERLSWEEVARLELRSVDFPGAYIATGQQRHYPLGEAAAHLLGYLGVVVDHEVKEGDPLLRLPDFRIGKSGVEKLLDLSLRGQAGIRQLEVNAGGLVERELKSQPSRAGEQIPLTIHAGLQRFAHERLAGQAGAVIAMDVHKGDILALVSAPAFDPDIFSQTIPTAYWKQLHDDKMQPLIFKPIQGQYPPGSTFKMLVGLAALKTNVATPSMRVHCPGHFDLGNHRFNCWKPEGHGAVNLQEAIAVSCDTYFYTMAQRLGIAPIAEMARAFGLGKSPGLGLVGEKEGVVPDEAWKQKSYGQKWQAGDTVNVGIGQGYILATPMQLCLMTARLVNGGQFVKPRLQMNEAIEPAAPIEVDPGHLQIIVDGMNAVVNDPRGTAYGKRIADKGFEFGGKTGTSQVRKILQRGMDQNKLPWEYRHHALFVGYAPVEAPRYAVSVLVEHGGGGASAAAPVARDVLEYVQQHEV